jgi:hypothetical protein
VSKPGVRYSFFRLCQLILWARLRLTVIPPKHLLIEWRAQEGVREGWTGKLEALMKGMAEQVRTGKIFARAG